MSSFWSLWIIALTVTVLAGSCWLLFANRKTRVSADTKEGEPGKTGHVYDGIEEYDNPLPAWWFWGFFGTIVFAVIYLMLYPGLGNFSGLLGWTQEKQWEEREQQARQQLDTQFASYAAMPIEDLAGNPAAMRIGRRLFNINCSVCHAVGGTGGNGFPNLTDQDWLYGGSPEIIRTSITDGRRGGMPAWAGPLGDDGVENVTNYVLSLSGAVHDEGRARAGGEVFATFCTACHGAEGKGNPDFGAPNLTDDIWLYRQENLSLADNIRQTVRAGRNGMMPSHKDKLRDEKIHVLAAYVYSLSRTNR